MLPKKARILLACAERAYTRLLAVLPGHELTYARKFTDAEAALKAHGFDLIMIGSRFIDFVRKEFQRRRNHLPLMPHSVVEC
jgi:hypothetical protein